jgi:uracil-DNA glycosylase
MKIFKNVHESWLPFIRSLTLEKSMVSFLQSLEKMSYQPPQEEIFRVFEMPIKDIEVVLLGTEPYSIPRVATGYAYSIGKEGGLIPKEITYLHKKVFELYEGVEKDVKVWGRLDHWKSQGVFLLNSSLTVETGHSFSHTTHWKAFTQSVISYLSSTKGCIWLMFGMQVQHYNHRIHNPYFVEGYDRETIEEIPIDKEQNYVLVANHPITYGVGGDPLDIFYLTNEILKRKSNKEITW